MHRGQTTPDHSLSASEGQGSRQVSRTQASTTTARGRRLSLRTLILLTTLAVLALPLAMLAGLRVVETWLHRQTEAKLLAEAAYVATLYHQALRAEAETAGWRWPPEWLPDLPPVVAENLDTGRFRPLLPRLDLLRDTIGPSAQEGRLPLAPAEPLAVAAGEALAPLLSAAQELTLSAVRVLDARGVVVASTGAELGLDLSEREEVRAALAGQPRTLLRRRPPSSEPGPRARASRVRLFVAVPISEGPHLLGVAYLSRTSLSLVRDAWEPRYGLALLGVLALTLALGLALATLLARPLRTLSRAAQAIARGQPDVPLVAPDLAPREAHELATALAAMLAELRRRLDYVQEFSRSLAHELKTPLASILGALELLRDSWPAMAPDERERFLANIDLDARRLERLVKRLTVLARLEAGAPGQGGERLHDLRPVLQALIARQAERGQAIGLRLHGPAPAGSTGGDELHRPDAPTGAPCRLERARGDDGSPAPASPDTLPPLLTPVPPDLAEILFGNLLDNAVLHGAAPWELEVTCSTPAALPNARSPAAQAPSAAGAQPALIVRVRDHGPGISPANQARLFTRFFTTARERGGTGLGLAIARAVARAHGGELDCASRPGETVFSVTLPLG